jgi:hypothetical protein
VLLLLLLALLLPALGPPAAEEGLAAPGEELTLLLLSLMPDPLSLLPEAGWLLQGGTQTTRGAGSGATAISEDAGQSCRHTHAPHQQTQGAVLDSGA